MIDSSSGIIFYLYKNYKNSCIFTFVIEIKRCNYITGDINSVSHGLSRIIDFLETSGRNPIFLSKPKSTSSSNLLSFFSRVSKIEFNDKQEFENILINKSNLFRVDLLVVDLWHLHTVNSVIDYKELLDRTGIDYIIISNKYHYIDGDDTRVYKIDKETSPSGNYSSDYKYTVTEQIAGWKSSLDDLVVSYKRDKKIDDILGETE
jgi:hypothetical protein